MLATHLYLSTLPHYGVWSECRYVDGEVSSLGANPTGYVHTKRLVRLLEGKEGGREGGGEGGDQ